MKNEIQSYNFCKNALELEKKMRNSYFILAGCLYKIQNEKLYEPHWSSFEEFCWEFKDISSSTVSKLISVYKKFILEFNLSPVKLNNIGYSLLYAIIPVVKTKEDADEWLLKAEELTRSDLSKFIKEKQTGIDMTKCKHKDFYEIRICRDCGERQRIENETT